MRMGLLNATVLAMVLGIGTVAQAQDVEVATGEEALPAEAAGILDEEDLDALVAPVALYPDALLAQVVVAATYPLDLVKADRFLDDTADMTSDDRTGLANAEAWDPSVQVLAAGFPTVVRRMAEEIEWTEQLGEAALAQTDDLLAAVQRMRARATAAGTLTSNPAQIIEIDDDTIAITPADPGVVYVPEYDAAIAFAPAVAGQTPVVTTGPASATYPAYQEEGWTIGDTLTTGAIAFGSALLIDEIFDDNNDNDDNYKDDWNGYWRGPRAIDWDDAGVYARPRAGVGGDVNIDRGNRYDVSGNTVNINRADVENTRIELDRDKVQVDNDRLAIDRGDGGWPNRPGAGGGERPDRPGAGGDGERPDRPGLGGGDGVGGGNGNRPNLPDLGGNGADRPPRPGGGDGERPERPGLGGIQRPNNDLVEADRRRPNNDLLKVDRDEDRMPGAAKPADGRWSPSVDDKAAARDKLKARHPDKAGKVPPKTRDKVTAKRPSDDAARAKLTAAADDKGAARAAARPAAKPARPASGDAALKPKPKSEPQVSRAVDRADRSVARSKLPESAEARTAAKNVEARAAANPKSPERKAKAAAARPAAKPAAKAGGGGPKAITKPKAQGKVKAAKKSPPKATAFKKPAASHKANAAAKRGGKHKKNKG